MSVRTLKSETGTSYYCTITNCKWLPLFEVTDFYQKIYDWFDFLKKRGDHIIGYVIMPNHLHCIIFLQKGSPLIKDVIGEAKRLMSYSIISRLKKAQADYFLRKLQSAVSGYEKRKGLIHKVFEDSFDGKECYTYEFIQQKLKYMHENPLKKRLCNIPSDYIHSSATFYESGADGIYPVTHYIEVYEGKETYEFSKRISDK